MTELDVVFLNLGTAVERRDAFLRAYAECGFAPHWHLRRFHAIDAAHHLVRTTPGRLGDGNKGCYFSSLECIRQSLDTDRHLFIVDDDIRFAPTTQRWADKVLAQLADQDWDILLTDTIIPRFYDMPRLFLEWYRSKHSGAISVINLNTAQFSFCAGSTIINRRARRKILDAMTTDVMNLPWDVLMRTQIQGGRIKAMLLLPYLTTVSHFADDSQIGPDVAGQVLRENRLYSAFRRMVWIGADPPASPDTADENYPYPASHDVERFNRVFTPLMAMQMRYIID